MYSKLEVNQSVHLLQWKSAASEETFLLLAFGMTAIPVSVGNDSWFSYS